MRVTTKLDDFDPKNALASFPRVFSSFPFLCFPSSPPAPGGKEDGFFSCFVWKRAWCHWSIMWRKMFPSKPAVSGRQEKGKDHSCLRKTFPGAGSDWIMSWSSSLSKFFTDLREAKIKKWWKSTFLFSLVKKGCSALQLKTYLNVSSCFPSTFNSIHSHFGPSLVTTGKESACNAGDPGSIPGLGRDPGEGKGYPLQYSGLETSMDCIAHGMAKNWTRLSDFHFHSHFWTNNRVLKIIVSEILRLWLWLYWLC